MVAQHYRWDFIGLSTDSKPDATNPKVADGSTYYESNTSKLFVWYKDRWYEKTATGGYELPIASASTLGGVKVGEGLEISEAGVLSATGGSGGGIVILTEADYDFPNNNPDSVALWRLPSGIYQCTGLKVSRTNATSESNTTSTFIINRRDESETTWESQIWQFSGQFNGLQLTSTFLPNVEGGDAGSYAFTLT